MSKNYICDYYNSKDGCRFGDKCKKLHIKKKSNQKCKYFNKNGYFRNLHIEKNPNMKNMNCANSRHIDAEFINILEKQFVWSSNMNHSRKLPLTWGQINLYISQFVQMPMPLIKIVCEYFGFRDFTLPLRDEEYSIYTNPGKKACGFCPKMNSLPGEKIITFQAFCRIFDFCDPSSNKPCNLCKRTQINLCSNCWPLMYGYGPIELEGYYFILWSASNFHREIFTTEGCRLYSDFPYLWKIKPYEYDPEEFVY